MFDELFEGERVLIYSLAQNLYHLSCSKTWYGDGTFSVPPIFKQVYTIHGEYLGSIFPMAVRHTPPALTLSKTISGYIVP